MRRRSRTPVRRLRDRLLHLQVARAALTGGALLTAALPCVALASPAARTTEVYAVVARYADTSSNPRAPATLRKILQSVRAFYAEGSGGSHQFTAEVHPSVLELAQPRPAGNCRLPDSNVLSAALREAGISLNDRHALVLVVPASAQGCRGGVQTWFAHREADGSVRRVPLAVSWSLTGRFVAHEIVHTHGIGHAKTLACSKASLGVDCRTKEYGNVWDLMGNGSFQMLSAPLRTHMGWTEPVVHGGGTATYTLGAATRPGGLPTAVQVRLPFAGNDAVKVVQPLSLWVEYRPPIGFDKRMAAPALANFANGAMVHVTGSWRGATGARPRALHCPTTSPCLVDATPQTGSFKDAGVALGTTWTEPFSGVRLTVDSRTETTLTVTVSVP